MSSQRSRTYRWLAIVLASSGLIAGWPCHVAAANERRQEIVGRSATRLVDRGQTFYTPFANQYYLWYKPSFMADEILSDAHQLGLNAIRLFIFCEGTSKDGYCFQPQAGQYDEATFQKLDYVLYRAGRLGVRLILPLVNNWDDGFGGMRQYVNWAKQADLASIPEDLRASWLETVSLNSLTPGSPEFRLYQRYHDLFYTNAHARELYQRYIEHVLSRVNHFTGRMYKENPTILMWELANESRCESDSSGATVHAWLTEMAAFLKQRDPNHLLSTGEEGWYRDPSRPGDFRYNGQQGVDYLTDHQVPGIDACSFHLYPPEYGLDEPGARQWIASHVADCHRLIGKPVYFGEFGMKVDRQASARTDEVLHTFATDPEGWATQWGYRASDPVWVDQPAKDGHGAIQYHTDVPIGPGAATLDAAGSKTYSDPGISVSGFDWVSGFVRVPDNAPQGLQADFFVQSGPSWQWTDGPDVPLTPGQWHEVAIPTNTIADPTAVHRIGMRLLAYTTTYDGEVFYDRVSRVRGSLVPSDVQMAERNRIYGDWRTTIDTSQADGEGVWYLSGLQENGQLDPDPSHYAVFFPEDAGTDAVLSGMAQDLASKSGQPISLWEACEVAGRGSASSSYSDATALSIDTQHVKQGAGSCRLDYQPSGYQKAYWEFSPLDENWTERPILAFPMFSPQAGLQADVVVSTGADWTWHESLSVPLKAGWNMVRINLQSSTWKTEASQWMPTERIANLSEVHRLSVGLFGYSVGGSIWLDAIRLTSPPRIVDLHQTKRSVSWAGEDDEGRHPRSLQFSFQIDSGTWSAWGPTHSLSLQKLHKMVGPGEHVLDVRAQDTDGVLSEVKRLRVTIP